MFVLCWVGSGLCNELIAGTEVSYRVCLCVCVSNCLRSRTLKIYDSFIVQCSVTHTKHLLFHAQCFLSYQPVSSPPLQQLTVMWSLLHCLLFHVNRSISCILIKVTVLLIILFYKCILSTNCHSIRCSLQL